jgi:signal transduction histidine kinase
LWDRLTLRPPAGLWSAKGTLLVLAALLGPTLASLALVHSAGFAATVTASRAILVSSGALVAAGLLVGHARLAGNDHSLWLATASGVFAVSGLARGGYGLTHPAEVEARTATILVGVLAVTTALTVMLYCGRRWGGDLNPLVVAAPLTVALLVAQQLAMAAGPGLDHDLVPVLAVLLVVAVLGFAAVVQGLDALPHWVRDRVSVAVCLGVAGGLVLLPAVPGDRETRSVVSVLLGLGMGLLLATTGAALLRQVMADGQRQLSELQSRLAAAEAQRREDGARLHDINSLVAGIASASRLIRELPPSEQRAGLEVLVLAELERLQRLADDRSPHRGRGRPRRGHRRAPVSTFPVSEVTGRIALAHRARGRDVRWQVSDICVAGHPDDLALLLDLLIDNAAIHGSPHDISLGVRRVRDEVEISVSDRGPGVPAEIRQTLFEWGVRGADSDGSGIGLASASALAARLGGRLALDGSAPGTRMVLTLPAPLGAVAREELAVAGF